MSLALGLGEKDLEQPARWAFENSFGLLLVFNFKFRNITNGKNIMLFQTFALHVNTKYLWPLVFDCLVQRIKSKSINMWQGRRDWSWYLGRCSRKEWNAKRLDNQGSLHQRDYNKSHKVQKIIFSIHSNHKWHRGFLNIQYMITKFSGAAHGWSWIDKQEDFPRSLKRLNKSLFLFTKTGLPFLLKK